MRLLALGKSPTRYGSPSSVGRGAALASINLLLWTEEFDNAAWTKTAVTVTADLAADPLGGSTADTAVDAVGGGAVRQSSATTASTGSAATATVSPLATWSRFSVTGTFDGVSYTWSVHLQDLTETATLRLRLDRFAGKLRASVENLGGAATFNLWGAQLEQAASASAYEHRTT